MILGMISVLFPIFFSLLTGIIGTIRDKAFRFDFLIPLELFIFIILGGVLLTYVAYKQRKRFGLTLTELILTIVTLALSQLIAVVSGLALTHSQSPKGGLDSYQLMADFHGEIDTPWLRRCGWYRTPTGEVKAPTKWFSPRYLLKMLIAPTPSLWYSNPH